MLQIHEKIINLYILLLVLIKIPLLAVACGLVHALPGPHDTLYPFLLNLPDIAADVEYGPVVDLKDPLPAGADALYFLRETSFRL